MPLASQQWILFGYDLRQLSTLARTLWSEVLNSPDGFLRRNFDEQVTLIQLDKNNREDISVAAIGGANLPAKSTAIVLPDELQLSLLLNLPVAAESYLESAVALEVQMRSPFAAGDTVYGYREVTRKEGTLEVALVLASKSAVEAYLNRAANYPPSELWANVYGHWVVISGYAENAREQRYKRRLLRVAAWSMAIFLLTLVLMAIPVGLRHIQLNYYQDQQFSAQQAAAPALALRNSLVASNQRIEEINAWLAGQPNGLQELARLTAALPDDAYLTNLELSKEKLRIEGMASNAALLMQTLSELNYYSKVTAPSAIRRDPRSQLERFVLDLQVSTTQESVQ